MGNSNINTSQCYHTTCTLRKFKNDNVLIFLFCILCSDWNWGYEQFIRQVRHFHSMHNYLLAIIYLLTLKSLSMSSLGKVYRSLPLLHQMFEMLLFVCGFNYATMQLLLCYHVFSCSLFLSFLVWSCMESCVYLNSLVIFNPLSTCTAKSSYFLPLFSS